MNSSPIFDKSLLPNLSTLRDLLELLSSLGSLSDPFASPDGLHKVLAVLIQLGNTLGLDPNYVQWLSAMDTDPQLFNLVLAAGNYLESLIAPAPPTPPAPQTPTAVGAIQVQTIDFGRLLSILAEILQLLQQFLTPQTTS